MNLSNQSNHELLLAVTTLLGSHREITAKLVAHLAEIEERRLHLECADQNRLTRPEPRPGRRCSWRSRVSGFVNLKLGAPLPKQRNCVATHPPSNSRCERQFLLPPRMPRSRRPCRVATSEAKGRREQVALEPRPHFELSRPLKSRSVSRPDDRAPGSAGRDREC